MESEKNVRVSIVIPVYNLEKYISETVRCVMEQSYKDWELILVNDKSTDGTVRVIEDRISQNPELNIRLIRNEGEGSAAAARNLGVKNSTGRYVAFLDGDDLWDPEKLEKQIRFMEERDSAFSFTGYEFADENGKGTGKIVRVPERLTYKKALGNTTIFTSTVMIDTEKVPRDVIVFPHVKSEDTALWWDLLKRFDRADGLDENLVSYRRVAGSLSSDKVEALRRIRNLHKREGLGPIARCYYFCVWAVRAVRRRI
ncbi:MAG: glycosyltransferase family 2 protein [Lachnospiraceae bacterium]|nr:glycosyltransferase family 2 protein [Lachnospiraceae bacterium]